MAKHFEFDKMSGRTGPHCVACEAMLADALDEVLDGADAAWFEAHVASCGDCATMLSEAQRGAAWLEMLKFPRPEPSAGLMDRILDSTSGAHGAYVPVVTALPAAGNVVPFRPRLPMLGWIEPRLAMTAAMAFFSIALTLNLTGVKLDEVRASDLRPENLKKAFYQADAKAVRTYENLRVVRVMESRVDGLRDSVQTDHRVQPEEKKEAPAPAGKGMSWARPDGTKWLQGRVEEPMQIPFGNDKQGNGQPQRQPQILFGNDNRKATEGGLA